MSDNETTKEAAENGSVDFLVDAMVENEPEPTESVVANDGNNGPSVGSEGTGSNSHNNRNNGGLFVDSSGVSFNPAIHETQEDGSPRRTKDGRFRRKRGRRSMATEQPTVTGPTESERLECRALSVLSVQVVTGMACVVLGPDWAPTAQETQVLTENTEKVFLHYGITDLPPLAMLGVAVACYAAPRLNTPEKRAAVAARLRGEKPNAHDDLGNN